MRIKLGLALGSSSHTAVILGCKHAWESQYVRGDGAGRVGGWVSLGISSPASFCGVSITAAAKSLQSCLTLCDPRDGSPPGSPIPGILQVRTLEWVAISFSNAWKWNVKVKSLSHVWLLATPWTAAHQAPPSLLRWVKNKVTPRPGTLLECSWRLTRREVSVQRALGLGNREEGWEACKPNGAASVQWPLGSLHSRRQSSSVFIHLAPPGSKGAPPGSKSALLCGGESWGG